MASNARNLSKLLGTSTQVPTTALPPAIADLETVGETLSGGEIAPSSIKSNTLTQSFDSNQAVTFNMADSIDAVSPIVSVFKEVPVSGVSSKGQWDVNANATNYEFFDEKPISYASTTLTPSATGDGTFTSSNPITTVFDLSSSSAYTNVFTPTRQQTSIGGATQIWYLKFKSDGTKMYHFSPQEDSYYQYSLSTAWDISSATYEAEWDMTAISGFVFPGGMAWKSDGTKIYWYGRDAAARFIRQHALTTAWDISTVSDTIEATSITSPWSNQSGIVYGGLTISPDGTKWYSGGANTSSNDIEIATFATAWDITSSITNSSSSNLAGTVEAIDFNSDGTQYLESQTDGVVRRYTLSTAYDLTTRGAATQTIDLTTFLASFTTIRSMTVSADRTKLYVGSDSVYKILEIDIGNILAFNSAAVGKKVVGNSGSAIITGTSGTYKSVTAFADTSAISSWQLFGAEGKADETGIQLAQAGSPAENINAATANSLNGQNSSIFSSHNTTLMKSFHMSDDGTHIALTVNNTQTLMYQMSTPFDISTVGSSISTLNRDQYASTIWMNGDGTRYVIANFSGNERFYMYTMSTPYDFSTNTLVGYFTDNVKISNHNPGFVEFNADGTKMFYGFTDISTASVIGILTMTTPWDLSTGSATYLNFNSTFGFTASNNETTDWFFNSDGTRFFINNGTDAQPGDPDDGVWIRQYNLTTPYDLTTASYSNYNLNVSGTAVYHMQKADNGQKLIFAGYDGTNPTVGVYDIAIDAGTTTPAYNQYFPALTNSSTGQINSSSWLDINSMTADETKNDGDVFYAVSTDNRSSWSVAKGSDGVRKIARNNSGTWQYNNDSGSSTTSGFSLSSPSYESEIKLDTGTGGWNSGWPANSVAFNNDGTKMYGIINAQNAGQNPAVYEFSLSTAYDVSTASYTTWINVQPNTGNRGLKSHVSLQFSPNGQYMYVNSATNDHLSVYTLSTAWDISTASHTRNVATTGFSTGYGGFVTSNGIIWQGALGNVQDLTFQTINDYSLSSVGSAQYISGAFGSFNPETLVANADATKIFIHTGNTGSGSEGWVEYTRSSSSAISTSDTLTQTNVWNHGLSYDPKAGQFSVDGTKMIIATDVTGGKGARVFSTTGTILSYGTSETWVNGTNNNEHATLQEALGSQSLNRMDKAQLDAVADNYHFSQDSADTLDLMIAPYAASGTSPISDGVTINYDAAALIREAIPGTDYIADFPNPTTLNITAVGAANLKIRAQ